MRELYPVRPAGQVLLAALWLLLQPGAAGGTVLEGPRISEVFYDAPGADGGLEWVELFNASPVAVDLGGWSLGFGGESYLAGLLPLGGTVAPGAYFVVGGPGSVPENGSPTFDLALDITPDLQNSGTIADGIALFDRLAAEITSADLPFDAVVYGVENRNGLVGPDGAVSPVHVGDAPAGHSLERLVSGSWRISERPSPGTGALDALAVPEPGTLACLLTGLIVLEATRRRSRKGRARPGCVPCVSPGRARCPRS